MSNKEYETVYISELDVRVNATIEDDEIWIVPCTRTYELAKETQHRFVNANYDADTDIYLWSATQEDVTRSQQEQEDVYEANVTGDDTYYDYIFIVNETDERYSAMLQTLEVQEHRHISS